MSLKVRINDDMKAAMRARDGARLGAIRLLLAAMKQKEVDERIELTDADVISIIEKMIKQRRDSIAQYEAAGRQELVEAEKFEISVLQAYLPQPLSEDEIRAIIAEVIASIGATGPQEMGRVMNALRPRLAGRADMGQVASLVKAQFSR